MAADESIKSKAWIYFDRIVAEAAPDGKHSNPWVVDEGRRATYLPDYPTLVRLLGVPLHLKAQTTTGVPALALDVWFAYELRRAGLDADSVWPRPEAPRVLPGPIASLLARVTRDEREKLWKRLTAKTPPQGAASNSANILGKNYLKQVDVGMSSWFTGPELLISTKRMDSSFGKNAANRVEESYGDAKNLRLRHPLAALGFAYGLRSTIFDEAPEKAEWLIDLLQKLGQEDDAYHAVALIIIAYDDDLAIDVGEDDSGDGENPLVEVGLEEEATDERSVPEVALDSDAVEATLAVLPSVELRQDLVPADLQPGHFLALMVRRLIQSTPVTMHREARNRLRDAPDVARGQW